MGTRELASLGVSKTAPPGWPSEGPSATGQIWVCRKTAHRQLVRFGCVENGARRPPGPGPGHLPKGPPSTGQIAHHQLAKFECRKFTTTSQVTEEKQVRESRKRRPAPPGPAPPPPVCGQGKASTGQLGVCRKRPPGTTKARPANWRAPNTPKPVRAPAQVRRRRLASAPDGATRAP